jgi:ABC-type dipeptide/oligopeptide/nickel transport system permease subunit
MSPQERRKLLEMLKGNALAQLAMGLILAVALVALIVPLLPVHDPRAEDLGHALRPPLFMNGGSYEYALGTDYLGRDILSRALWGSRMSVAIGLSGVVLALSIGVPLGLVAGYYGGRLDDAVMRVFDMILSLPLLLTAIAVLAIVGRSPAMVVGLLGVMSSPWFARTIRSKVLTVKSEEYVVAAIAIGASTTQVIVRHVAPNALAPVLILSTLWFGTLVIVESSLSFLGLTKQHISWGFMVAESKDYFASSWWTMTVPGVCIVATVLSANVLGDLLRDILDPRLVVHGTAASSGQARR